MDAKVTIEFNFYNVCNNEDLYEMTFEEMVKYLIKEEGICGVIDTENYKILKVEELID